MKPPFAYYGGKQTIAHRLVSLMPPHEHYVEPFFGSGSVLLAKPPTTFETANDLDRVLITFWRVLRDRPLELARACALTPHSRIEFDACRDDEAGDDLETARRIFTWLAQSRGSCTGNRKTGWRYFADPAGTRLPMPAYLDAYVARIVACAERLRSVSLECRPALDVIDTYGQHDSVLLYVDPPYVHSTRTSLGYRHELTDGDHRDLAEALHACRASVLLSGYDSALYDDMYADWHRHTIPTGTGNGGGWVERTEVIWSNRPLNEGRLFEVTG